MTNLATRDILDIFQTHLEAEGANDMEKVRATLSANPSYEFPTLGLKIDGQEGVLEFYRRTLTRMRSRGLTAPERLQAFGSNAFLREAYVTFDFNGEKVTGNYCAVIVIDPNERLITSERLYSDPLFARVFAEDLGEDFEHVPGVSKMDWTRYEVRN